MTPFTSTKFVQHSSVMGTLWAKSTKEYQPALEEMHEDPASTGRHDGLCIRWLHVPRPWGGCFCRFSASSMTSVREASSHPADSGF